MMTVSALSLGCLSKSLILHCRKSICQTHTKESHKKEQPLELCYAGHLSRKHGSALMASTEEYTPHSGACIFCTEDKCTPSAAHV